jgi:predicted RNA-binding Zn-ribbon protein involved in translation (DUF1610 family)
MKKSPRFFCENCGAEVGRNEKACPRCGKFFASVRCPSCGFTGAEGLFTKGCPLCGYSAPPAGHIPGPRKKPPLFKAPRYAAPRFEAGALPLWIYLLSVFALICVVIVIFFVGK